MTAAPIRRNSFQELFGAGASRPAPVRSGPASAGRKFAVSVTSAQASPPPAKSAPPALAKSSPVALAESAPPVQTSRAVAETSTVNPTWFRPSAPVSLAALEHALVQAGLNPAHFQFEQVEAEGNFPGRPDLSYVTRQVLIRGPHGAGLFDRDLALRTPWVTAVELRTYGIV